MADIFVIVTYKCSSDTVAAALLATCERCCSRSLNAFFNAAINFTEMLMIGVVRSVLRCSSATETSLPATTNLHGAPPLPPLPLPLPLPPPPRAPALSPNAASPPLPPVSASCCCFNGPRLPAEAVAGACQDAKSWLTTVDLGRMLSAAGCGSRDIVSPANEIAWGNFSETEAAFLMWVRAATILSCHLFRSLTACSCIISTKLRWTTPVSDEPRFSA
jgi:hypothetical protein